MTRLELCCTTCTCGIPVCRHDYPEATNQAGDTTCQAMPKRGRRMSTTLTFTIPADLWLSANDRMHWAPKAKATKVLRALGWHTAMAEIDEPFDVCHVAAFIGYLRNGKADPANAAPTVKALIDGLTDAGVWADDDHTHVIGPTYLRDPKSPTPGHYTIRLVLTPQDIPWHTETERP